MSAPATPACRICGCTDLAPCPIGCAWVEGDDDEALDLCDNCDAFIDCLAVDINAFTLTSAASIGQTAEDHTRYTAAVNKALSEASGRLRRFHAAQAEKPLIEVVGG